MPPIRETKTSPLLSIKQDSLNLGTWLAENLRWFNSGRTAQTYHWISERRCLGDVQKEQCKSIKTKPYRRTKCRSKCRSKHKISLGETECKQKNHSERYGIPAREETHTMGRTRQRWTLGNHYQVLLKTILSIKNRESNQRKNLMYAYVNAEGLPYR